MKRKSWYVIIIYWNYYGFRILFLKYFFVLLCWTIILCSKTNGLCNFRRRFINHTDKLIYYIFFFFTLYTNNSYRAYIEIISLSIIFLFWHEASRYIITVGAYYGMKRSRWFVCTLWKTKRRIRPLSMSIGKYTTKTWNPGLSKLFIL